jgi:hypothetical protein
MPNLPSFNSYGNYSSGNYGVHALQFSDGNGNTYYFSYRTLVAFYTHRTGLVCRQNDWGTTTGKHLNWIEPDKSKRVDAATFKQKYEEAFADEPQEVQP